MKKLALALSALILTTTIPQTHALEWKNAAPYVIGIPTGLAASGFSLWSNAYAQKTFLKNAGKIGRGAFGILNTTLCICGGIATAWYVAKKTNQKEDSETQQHIAEKTIDIAGLSAILGLIGYYVHKASPKVSSTAETAKKGCGYLALAEKLPTLPPVPEFSVCDGLLL